MLLVVQKLAALINIEMSKSVQSTSHTLIILDCIFGQGEGIRQGHLHAHFLMKNAGQVNGVAGLGGEVCGSGQAAGLLRVMRPALRFDQHIYCI